MPIAIRPGSPEQSIQRIDRGLPQRSPVPTRRDDQCDLQSDRPVSQHADPVDLFVDVLFEFRGLPGGIDIKQADRRELTRGGVLNRLLDADEGVRTALLGSPHRGERSTRQPRDPSRRGPRGKQDGSEATIYVRSLGIHVDVSRTLDRARQRANRRTRLKHWSGGNHQRTDVR